MAGIIEDDILGSLEVPLPVQPLPAREQRLPKIMNPAARALWHPPPARVRKDWGAEPVPQLKTIE